MKDLLLEIFIEFMTKNQRIHSLALSFTFINAYLLRDTLMLMYFLNILATLLSVSTLILSSMLL